MISSSNISTPIMPVQNVIQHADMRPGEPVIKNAQLFGGFDTTMMQTNRQAINNGENAVSERMYAARAPIAVSNFGTETKIGNGDLSRASHETLETSVEAIATIMEKDDEYEASKVGDYSALGPTGFQDYNDRSFQTQQAKAAQAYEYFSDFQ